VDELISELNDIGSQLYVEPGRRDAFRREFQDHHELRDFQSAIYRRDHSIRRRFVFHHRFPARLHDRVTRLPEHFEEFGIKKLAADMDNKPAFPPSREEPGNVQNIARYICRRVPL